MTKKELLIKKGVTVIQPESIEISDDIDIDKISGKDVVIYPGCRLRGNSTIIGQGTKLGEEAPVTIENCQTGADVQLKGGFFKKAVFLEKASIGSGAHVREGTILEEEASCAHTVGLKHTILFPFVTLGSLINFCDCFMSGGTSRKNHSEVGSSYIHFNYTPNQDKATASLLGNVYEGVMLNQKPIFLGGQGGLVGPTLLAFGTVTAAGTIVRKDETKQGRLIFGGVSRGGSIPILFNGYQNIKRIILNNVTYIANLNALVQWYKHIRKIFISEKFPEILYNSVLEKLDLAITERVKRLKIVSDKMQDSVKAFKTRAAQEESLESKRQLEFYNNFNEIEDSLLALRNFNGNLQLRDTFCKTVEKSIEKYGYNYISVIKGIDKNHSEIGSLWLQDICNYTINSVIQRLSLIA